MGWVDVKRVKNDLRVNPRHFGSRPCEHIEMVMEKPDYLSLGLKIQVGADRNCLGRMIFIQENLNDVFSQLSSA